MRARFEFAGGCPPWGEIRGRLMERFASLDCRAIPADGPAYESWSVHPPGSRLYYGFQLRRDGRLQIDGTDLYELDSVLTALVARQVPPADVARVDLDRYRFIASAAWEPEGCELFVAELPNCPFFQIERSLLANPSLAPLTAALLSSLPQLSDEECDPVQVASVGVSRRRLVEALSSFEASSLVPQDRYALSEALACRTALSSWLARRQELGERVSARLFVSDGVY